MNITTKLVGLLAACVLFSSHAAVVTNPITRLDLTFEELQSMDKAVASKIQECAKDDKSDKIITAIKDQLTAPDVDLVLDSDDQTALEGIVNSGMQDHQDRITPAALTGDISYEFNYKEAGSPDEEVEIKRREITDLLGKFAKLRMTQKHMSALLETVGDDAVKNFAKDLDESVENLNTEYLDLRTRIVKLIKCLADDAMYAEFCAEMAKDGLEEEDCLVAAHEILSYSIDSGTKTNVSKKSALDGLAKIADGKVTADDALEYLTQSVLQAFTTLLFLQETGGDKAGAVQDLNKYLITRGNARKVMKDTGGQLLLCDDISLEESSLQALGLNAAGAKAVAGVLELGNSTGKKAYVLPAAVLLNDKGEGVVGTPVLPAPYLEYVINHGELVPANNIIVDGAEGVKSVLTTYGTSLGLGTAGAAVSAVEKGDPDKNGTGLSGIGAHKKFVPSGAIDNPANIYGDTAATVPSGTNTSAEGGTKLDAYGAAAATPFKFTLSAATMIMNSLLAQNIAVSAKADGKDGVDNVATGPFYAARILGDNCPAKKAKVNANDLYDSTAAVMLCSGKDNAIRELSSTTTQDVAIEKDSVAKRIAAVSEYVIPGFDVDNNGDYVVTGLNESELKDMTGLGGSVTSAVLKGKGVQLLSAIMSISKSSK